MMNKYYLVFVFLLYTVPVIAQDAETLIEKGYSAYEDEKYEAAINFFDQAEKIDNSNPELYYLRGVCKSLINENPEALKDFARAIELKPDYPEVFYEIGYSNFMMNQFEAALDGFSKAISLKPDYAEAYINRGTVYCMIDKKEKAAEDYQKAKTLGLSLPFSGCD